MHRPLVDRSAHVRGPLGAWDPRLKLPALVLFVCAISFLPLRSTSVVWGQHLLLAGLVLFAVLWARASAGVLALQSLLVLPFAGMVAATHLVAIGDGGTPLFAIPWTSLHFRYPDGGAERAALVLLRVWTTILATLLVIATTPLPSFLRALERCFLPQTLVVVIGLVYRYVWVLREEAGRMLVARRMRTFGGRGWVAQGIAGAMVGTLFVRTLERSEGVHRAMLQRGYCGSLPILDELRWTYADTMRLCAICLLLALALVQPLESGAP